MSLISNRLDAIFEEASSGNDSVEVALEIMRKLENAKQVVLELRNRLKASKNGIVGDLALGIRRRHPSFNVGVGNRGFTSECKIGYKSKSLIFKPDLKKNNWHITSADNQFLEQFTKDFAQATVLRSDVSNIVDAISEHFCGHFGEDISGDGVILVEGKKGNSLDIMTWKNCSRPRLISRKARRL